MSSRPERASAERRDPRISLSSSLRPGCLILRSLIAKGGNDTVRLYYCSPSPPKHSNPTHPLPTTPPPPGSSTSPPKPASLVRNVNGSDEAKRYIIEATGSGVAILDYDRDGWQDIFLVNGTTLEATTPKAKPTSHLFHNNHDGTFTDVTPKGRPRAHRLGPGRLRRRLRQRRLRRPLRHRLRQEPPLPQSGQRHVQGRLRPIRYLRHRQRVGHRLCLRRLRP